MPLSPPRADVPAALRSAPEEGAGADPTRDGPLQEGERVTWITARKPHMRTEGTVIALMGDKARIKVGTLGHSVHVPIERLERVSGLSVL